MKRRKNFAEQKEIPPGKGLEPWTVGLKVQRSTNWATRACRSCRHILIRVICNICSSCFSIHFIHRLTSFHRSKQLVNHNSWMNQILVQYWKALPTVKIQSTAKFPVTSVVIDPEPSSILTFFVYKSWLTVIVRSLLSKFPSEKVATMDLDFPFKVEYVRINGGDKCKQCRKQFLQDELRIATMVQVRNFLEAFFLNFCYFFDLLQSVKDSRWQRSRLVSQRLHFPSGSDQICGRNWKFRRNQLRRSVEHFAANQRWISWNVRTNCKETSHWEASGSSSNHQLRCWVFHIKHKSLLHLQRGNPSQWDLHQEDHSRLRDWTKVWQRNYVEPPSLLCVTARFLWIFIERRIASWFRKFATDTSKVFEGSFAVSWTIDQIIRCSREFLSSDLSQRMKKSKLCFLTRWPLKTRIATTLTWTKFQTLTSNNPSQSRQKSWRESHKLFTKSVQRMSFNTFLSLTILMLLMTTNNYLTVVLTYWLLVLSTNASSASMVTWFSRNTATHATRWRTNGSSVENVRPSQCA